MLGYTAEEYIGQPIMKFCPDEEALVLEIFKQLGSGNTIRDVPVRFRTKSGDIKHLLIDSNVNYKVKRGGQGTGNLQWWWCFRRIHGGTGGIALTPSPCDLPSPPQQADHDHHSSGHQGIRPLHQNWNFSEDPLLWS